MMAAVNPYAPPRAHVDDVSVADSEAEEIRREHIKHEASVRAIGALYYLSGTLLTVVGVAYLSRKSYFPVAREPLFAILGPFYLVLGIFMLFVARGVRTLQPWARIASIAVAAFGLVGFPVGTLINGYILYLMLAQKGKRIFADDYKDIIAATPHVKYRTSIVVWVIVAILVLVVVGGLIFAATRG